MSRTLRLPIFALCALALACGAAFSQEAPKSTQQKPKPAKKAKKVWTADDLHAVRKPWHDYQDERAAEAPEPAQADAEANAQPARAAAETPAPEPAPMSATGVRLNVPNTAEGLRKQIEVYERTIANYHQRIADCRTKYFNTGDDEARKELQLEIDYLNSEIEKFGTDLKILETKLEERLAESQNQQPPAEPQNP